MRARKYGVENRREFKGKILVEKQLHARGAESSFSRSAANERHASPRLFRKPDLEISPAQWNSSATSTITANSAFFVQFMGERVNERLRFTFRHSLFWVWFLFFRLFIRSVNHMRMASWLSFLVNKLYCP